MADIRLNNLSRTYPGGVHAVDSLSLDIREGELLVLVGPSGSGKTTTLRLIAGLDRPTTGDIHIGDRHVNHVPPHARDVAMVFQNSALYPHMTVERNLAFGLRRNDVSTGDLRQRIASACEILGINHLLARYPGELSGGERQRAAVAKAMVRRPAAFLFDEPLSNLDLPLRHAARAEIKALHRRLAATMVYVTHDQEEAMTLGDRIAVMHQGTLQQVGAPMEVYRSPANTFVAGFIGSPAMNFIPGTLHAGVEEVRFVEDAPPGAPSLHLTMPRELARALPPTVQQPGARQLVLGIRPQALRPAQSPAPLHIDLTIDLVEPLGHAIDLVCHLPSGRQLIIRQTHDQRREPGQSLRVEADASAFHLFEPGPSGRNLLLPDQPATPHAD